MKYPEKESSTLELKREIPQKQQIIKSIIGFCNQYGGKLVIGVADDGEIVGLPEEKVADLMSSLSHSIYSSCHPPIAPMVYAQRIGGKITIVIEVSAGLYKPYFIKSRGLQEGTYIRLGPTTVQASEEIIRELQALSHGRSPDELPVYSAREEDLNRDKMLTFFERRKKEGFSNKDIRSLLLSNRLLAEEHQQMHPTVAGLLLFGKEPQYYFSEAMCICTHFSGTAGREVLATRDCEGTLFEQYSNIFAWVTSCLNRSFSIQGATRIETLEVPESALREVIVNALVHRSYQFRSPTKLAIYDDRIEIFSPGTFPGPIAQHQLEMGFSYLRNPVLCKMFRKAGLMEKLASGFPILFESYRERKLSTPLVVEGSGFVKCILPRPTAPYGVAPLFGEREEVVLQLLARQGTIQVGDVEESLIVSKSTAHRLLSSMLEKGVIAREGKGPSTHYRRGQ
jgi:ATP-dependent DNA helicase RecG